MAALKGNMKENFLLYNGTAQKLYHENKDLPIIDYHCHLNINDILENKPIENITKLWLASDHYKWRLMRMGGVKEEFITGDASDYDKFAKFIETLQYAIGSPLYHWCRMELDKYFGIEDEILSQNTKIIYDKANKAIAENKLTPQKILNLSNVEKVCIVEDCRTNNLAAYKKVKESGLKTLIVPILRIDNLLLLSEEEIKKGTPGIIENYINAGCNSADIGIEYIDDKDEKTIEKISYLLNECYKNNFTVQLHFGPMRNNNKVMFEKLGVDKGYDSISEKPYLTALVKIFNKVEKIGKTIIYNLNPADNAKVATLTGNFAGDGIKGKVQMGAAWWFNDNKNGIKEFFKSNSDMGLLSASLGMLTDSRSITSYVRHDYFRRLLCDYVGEISERGEFTTQFEVMKKIIADIFYYNAKEFLSF